MRTRNPSAEKCLNMISITSVKKWGMTAAIAAFWLLLWQGITMAVDVEMLLPSPVKILITLGGMMGTSVFWITVATTVARVLVGFLIGFALGTGMAILAFRFSLFGRFLSPIIYVIKSTPVASFILLALWWMSPETVPSFICMLIVLPIVFSNVSEGLKAVDADLLEMSRVFRFSFGKRLRCVYLPCVVPYFTAASGVSLGLSWKAGIAAEVICRCASSIGNAIYESKFYLEIREMYAWTVVVILLSVLFDRLLKSVASRASRRMKKREEAAS